MFIHSSVDGHGLFSPFDHMNTAAMNTDVQISVCVPTFILLDISLGVDFLGHLVVLCLKRFFLNNELLNAFEGWVNKSPCYAWCFGSSSID